MRLAAASAASRSPAARHATIAPYGPFPCATGSDVVIAVQNTKEWQALCSALDAPDLVADERFATNEGRVANGAELDERIGACTRRLDADELVERLETAGLAWGKVNDLFAVLEHPQLAARHRWADVATPNGTFQALRPPVDVEGIDIEMGRVPSLGEHTAAVLDWLRETGPR